MNSTALQRCRTALLSVPPAKTLFEPGQPTISAAYRHLPTLGVLAIVDEASTTFTHVGQSTIQGAKFDPASLSCADALPVKVLASSRGSHWRSALVEYQHVLACEDGFETLPTHDHTIVVMTSGEQELEARRGGRWQRRTYRPGSVGVTPGGEVDHLRRRIRREAGPARKVNIYVPQLFFAEAADHLGRAHPGRPGQALARNHSDTLVRHTALALLRAMRAGAPDIYLESTVRWLALHLLAAPGGVPASLDRVHRETISDKRPARVLSCIDHRYAEALSLAAAVGSGAAIDPTVPGSQAPTSSPAGRT